jgi:hypothetical protein
MMKRTPLFGLSATLLLAFTLSASAQNKRDSDKGNWRASSSTATAITGDITVSESKLAINFTTFPLAPIRTLQPAEVSAIFSSVDSSTAASGNLYRLSVPAEKRFLHPNTLCGSDEAQWMVTYVQGHSLQVAFFSGESMPILTPEAIAKSTDICGTFSYVH